MSKEAKDAHERGVTLLNAIKEYAPHALWKRYIEIGGESEELNTLPSVITPPLSDGTAPISDSPYGRRDEAVTLTGQMAAAIVQMLAEGELAGVGFLRPKALNPEHFWIPADGWLAGKIDWRNSELHTDSASYTDLRILPSSRTAEIDKAHNKSAQVGATSRKEYVLSAYKTLCDARKIDFTKSFNSQIPEIRNAAATLIDPTKEVDKVRGIGTESIRLAVGEQFERDKQAFLARGSS